MPPFISIRVSLPKVEFAKQRWLQAIASKQRAKSLPGLRKLFRQSVTGWSEKPNFGYEQDIGTDEIGIRVFPTGPHAEIWNLLNEGSPPHVIKPKNKKGLLSFQPGYRAATRPGQLLSGRKYRSGKKVVAKSVNHPGFQARRFTELIAHKFSEDYALDMQEAVTEVAQRI